MPALAEMNPLPVESEPADRPKAAMRFTYPSGSRPLEGYTIKRGVGRGGFGEVYYAVSDAGKEVALKLIRRNLEVELRGVTQCLNLKHPNLIALYDIRTDEHDDRWVVMEYVSGESLEDLINRHPEGMPKELVLRLFEGMAGAVAYLHDHGIVHRDLKPANIFFDEGIIKIGDYGLAKFISCSRRSGQTESVGTVHYMAPEIANGRYGREIDAYALGIILYEMLTGRVPFEGESVGEVLMKHLTAEPDLTRLDEPFRGVVRAAMAKNPEERASNVAAMLEMLGGSTRNAWTSGAAGQMPVQNLFSAEAEVHPHPSPRRASQHQASGGFVAFCHRDPEPVIAAARAAWPAMLKDLQYDQWTPLGRAAAAFFGLVIVVSFGPFWLSLAAMLLVLYVLYRVVRTVVRAVSQPPVTAPPAPALAPAIQPLVTAEPNGGPRKAGDKSAPPEVKDRRPWRHRGQGTWRHAAYERLAARPIRDRASSVFGSMLVASIVAPVAVFLAQLFTTREFNGELFLWCAIVATLGSWAVMVPAQLTEGRMEDHTPLRFTQLLLGALVGAAAWALASALYLNVSLAAPNEMGPSRHDTVFAELLHLRTGNDIDPLPLSGFTAYFAFLLVLLRWWRQAEWTRPTRVSLWAVAFCGLIAFGLSFFWWFPQPLGTLIAASIAFSVQLSSPWLSPSERKRLAVEAIA